MRYGESTVRQSLEEAIATAERSGVELNVSHLYPSPEDPVDEADRMIGMIEDARNRGIRVTWDTTVFPRGGGAWVQSLPLWALDGGMGAMQARLHDADVRRRIREFIYGDSEFAWANKWDDQLIVKVNRPEARALIGRTIGEIARERGTEPLDTALDLVIEEGQYWVAPVIKRQADLDRLLSHPLGVPVTDGMASHPEKHRDLGIMPKTFGSFPQILGRYVRDAGVMSLEHAIHQMTQVPALRVGIADRGVLADGLAADLTIFDPATIANRATESGDPAARPAGISRVMVNGRWAVVNGAATEARPGRAL
jgi:N-acyl-D-amino-acid deacylase